MRHDHLRRRILPYCVHRSSVRSSWESSRRSTIWILSARSSLVSRTSRNSNWRKNKATTKNEILLPLNQLLASRILTSSTPPPSLPSKNSLEHPPIPPADQQATICLLFLIRKVLSRQIAPSQRFSRNNEWMHVRACVSVPPAHSTIWILINIEVTGACWVLAWWLLICL